MKVLDTYLKHKSIARDDLAKASESELLELKDLAQKDIIRIDKQLLNAIEAETRNGKNHDDDWRNKATLAKRFKGLLINRINHELGRQRRAAIEQYRSGKDESAIHSLVVAMRAILTREQVKEVLTMWRKTRPEHAAYYNQQEEQNGKD